MRALGRLLWVALLGAYFYHNQFYIEQPSYYLFDDGAGTAALASSNGVGMGCKGHCWVGFGRVGRWMGRDTQNVSCFLRR